MSIPPSPLTADSDLVSIAITLDGAALEDRSPLASILIVCAAGRVPFARLTFALGEPPAPSMDLPPRAALVVAAGYPGRNRPIFSGALTTLGVRRRANASAVFIAEAHGATALPSFALADAARAPVLAVTYGVDLLEFDLEENPSAVSSGAKIRGTLGFQGSALVAPGDTIALGGLGVRFDGAVRIGGVAHVIEQGSWRTQVLVSTDARWFTTLTES
jgi:hypothetical protein